MMMMMTTIRQMTRMILHQIKVQLAGAVVKVPSRATRPVRDVQVRLERVQAQTVPDTLCQYRTLRRDGVAAYP
eukprot:904877-Rhodomonas_salina.1